MRYLNYFCKCAVILIGTLFFRPILDYLAIVKFRLPVLLSAHIGPIGDILFLIIEIIVIPMLITIIVIGILGGVWIGGKAVNGFIVSLTFYLWGFVIEITTLGVRADWVTFMNLVGFLIIPAVGTLIYGIFSKRRRARNCAITT